MTVTDPETLVGLSESDETELRRRRWARDRELRAPRSPQTLSTADFLTLGNAVCGFLAIYSITTNMLIPHINGSDGSAGGVVRHGAATAVTLLLLGSMCDLFDGLVARKLRSSALGAELDNLADLISFGIAPAYFVAVWGIVSPGGKQGLSAFIALTVLLAVVLRLARFSTVKMRPGVFQGMPCPMGAMTVIAIVLLDPPFLVGLLAIFGVAYLMVSQVEYPKPQGLLATATLAWIVVSIGCLAAWATGLPGGDVLMHVGAVAQIALAAMAPLLVIRRKVGQKVGDVRARRAENRGC
ncbi:CDP-diacylglycerol--serine O-phosphatidyltransferase [Kitasatospora sp. MAA4]|uniref:CDP-alcohol phosphatidyltransferase family protein n=1 Tax=Kitasatospora sp. MAA4 TaxID=3035093 RepID=UPI00247572DB|nr:CDP-alcohol phosphatidyltransferase family protein [Kitasatospora sp. MAA4]MDH6134384.1 CDP-diacylglycerol--serine O-phosphatidyltransferase [Kitasatospora sp. MAA4]